MISKQTIGMLVMLLWGFVIGQLVHFGGAAAFFLAVIAAICTYVWYRMSAKPSKTAVEQQAERVKKWLAAHPEEALKIKGEQKSDKIA